MQANVLEWLEGTAARLPDRTALWDETEQMTYREYRDGSVKIAGAILDTLGQSKCPIVVYIEKSVKVLVSFMGIAYSGNFYSPIDIDMPSQRVDRILEVL